MADRTSAYEVVSRTERFADQVEPGDFMWDFPAFGPGGQAEKVGQERKWTVRGRNGRVTGEIVGVFVGTFPDGKIPPTMRPQSTKGADQ